MVYYLIGLIVTSLTACVVLSYFTEMEGVDIMAFSWLLGGFWPVAIPFVLLVIALAYSVRVTRDAKRRFRGDGGDSNG